MEHNYNVFISYRGAGSGGLLGKEIYTDLRHCKHEDNQKPIIPFFAPACVQKGDNFQLAIKDALSTSRCVVLILSSGFFENCHNQDDMVTYELKEAMKNPAITFIPVVMDGFNFDKELVAISDLFTEDEIYRFKHINPIHHHGVYDFNTEADVVPAIRKALEDKPVVSKKTEFVNFDIKDFNIASGRIVRFGNYPQTILKDEDLIHRIYEGLATNATQKKDQRYEYNSKAYYNICENKFNKRTFETERTDGSYNFYIVEPLYWIEIFTNDKFSVLITKDIIDARMFNLDRNMHRSAESFLSKPANDWEVSFIRRWLNSEFYYDCFNETERESIQYSKIKNDKESAYIEFGKNRAPTVDKVFLISHQEIYAVGYGCARVSDFARAREAYASTSATCDRFGDWWTRSPGNIDSSVENVDRRGCLNVYPFCNYVNDTAAGVRPCIIVSKEVLQK